MNGPATSPRAVPPFSVLVITLVALLGHALLWGGQPVAAWVLPTALVLAACLRRPQLPRFDGWLPTGFAIAGTLAIAYGSTATMDRSWDGFATWSLTARHLAAGATLDHPYFANGAVYQAVRGYPLLQPILLQQASVWLGESGGRLLFPLLWVLLLMAVQAPLKASGVPPRHRLLAVTGMALVPMFTEPGHGSAESGFAELLLALLLTHAAAAIVLRQSWLALCVGLCLPLVKHEGSLHVAVLVVAATLGGVSRVAGAVAAGAAAALLGWVPMQQRLSHAAAASSWVVLGGALVPFVLVLWALAVRACRSWWQIFAVLLAAPAAGCGIVWQLPTALVDVAAAQFSSLPTWGRLGQVVGTLAEHLVWMRKFGLSFVVVVVVAAWVLRERRRPGSRWPALAPVFAYLVAWLTVVFLFLVALPAAQLPLFLREGTGRYLSQVLGVVWLAIGIGLADPGLVRREVGAVEATPTKP